MKKKLVAIGLILCMAFSLTGCMDMKVQDKISKDGTYTNTITSYIEKTAFVDFINRKAGSDNFETMEKSLLESDYTLQTIDGVEYYVSKPEVTKTTLKKFCKENQLDALNGQYQVWETGLYMNVAHMKDELGLEDSDISEGSLSESYEEDMKNLYEKSYIEYKVTFDYDVVKTDEKGVIDSADPKTVTWKMTYNEFFNCKVIEAYCQSGITVNGVAQGSTYKGTKKVKFTGATSATYNGKKVKSGAKYKKHGQHTIVLKAANGEQRTVSFFLDNKKPTIKGIKKNKTYKKGKYFTVSDKGSGVAAIRINGKKQSVDEFAYYLTKKGKNTIVVKDKVGNKTKIKVKVKK